MKKILIFIFIIFILSMPVNAEEITDTIISSVENELKGFENSLPEEIKNALPKELFDGDFSSLSNGQINQQTFIETVINILLAYLPSILKSFASILVLIIISSILNIMKKNFENESLNNAFNLCSSICVAIFIFTSIFNILNTTLDYMNTICTVMNAFTPIMSSMYIMSGNISSAAVSNAGIMLFITLVQNFIVIAIVPIVKISICFSIVKSLNLGIDIGGFSKVIKNTFTTVLIFTMTIFSFVMSYQNVLAQGNDSLSLRTARFAIGSFIPIVGASASEALKTVSSSLSIIKNSLGVFGIITISLITLPMIISLYLNKLSFDICASISKSLNCDNEASISEEASSICAFLLAVVFITCILFIFSITIFIKSVVPT